MKRKFFWSILILLSYFFISVSGAQAQADLPVVRAILFYSPTCPHCHEVINNTLLPMIEQYGDQLQIIGIDVSQPQGQQLFLGALTKFNLQEGGVPFLVIDDVYLIGSGDIPAKFPGMVEDYLAQGGVDFPDLPGLREVLPPTETPAPQEATPAPTTQAEQQSAPSEAATPQFRTNEDLTWQERFANDKAGNTLAVIFLAGMVLASMWTVFQWIALKGIAFKNSSAVWVIPVLVIIGFVVAGYLSYVETAEVAAVCGPVGDCNTVQQSEYARLFGILPIGVLGLVGYVAIFASWLAAKFGKGWFANLAVLALFGMSVFGTLFSMYLTFLEPFVIGATCMWCLTSAAIMTLLMLLTSSPAKQAAKEFFGSI